MHPRLGGAVFGTLVGLLIGWVGSGVHNHTNFFDRQEQVTVSVLGIPVHEESGPSGTAERVGQRWLPPLVWGFGTAGLLGGLGFAPLRRPRPTAPPSQGPVAGAVS